MCVKVKFMENVIELFRNKPYEVEYIKEKGKIVGVSHPQWPFRIMRRDNIIALVCEKTDEPFGELDRDVFNTVIMCWLLIDDPKIIDDAGLST